ncbi:hypothetical protein [Acidiphilium sp.]|uniref:hypothetical protein n=1 Tax=Acidiphilium sp. TaxID=527 RepID=UPI003D05CCE6
MNQPKSHQADGGDGAERGHDQHLGSMDPTRRGWRQFMPRRNILALAEMRFERVQIAAQAVDLVADLIAHWNLTDELQPENMNARFDHYPDQSAQNCRKRNQPRDAPHQSSRVIRALLRPPIRDRRFRDQVIKLDALSMKFGRSLSRLVVYFGFEVRYPFHGIGPVLRPLRLQRFDRLISHATPIVRWISGHFPTF